MKRVLVNIDAARGSCYHGKRDLLAVIIGPYKYRPGSYRIRVLDDRVPVAYRETYALPQEITWINTCPMTK